MRSPSTSPFPGVVIPPEAEPYCDSRGIIDWAKVAAELGLNPAEFWGWRLPSILKGIQDDDVGVLRRMRDLKLDRIVSAPMISRRGSTAHSHQRAIKFAQDFDIPLDQVVGTGPDSLILKRDVVAYRLGVRRGVTSTSVPDSRLLRQRRILADHLRECIRTKRGLEVLLDDQWNRHQREISELNDRLAATSCALAEAVLQKTFAQDSVQTIIRVFGSMLETPKPVTLVERARKFLQALRPHKTQKAATA